MEAEVTIIQQRQAAAQVIKAATAELEHTLMVAVAVAVVSEETVRTLAATMLATAVAA